MPKSLVSTSFFGLSKLFNSIKSGLSIKESLPHILQTLNHKIIG